MNPHIKANLRDGIACPCCGQFAKEYRRRITSSMARGLVTLYKKAAKLHRHAVAWVNVPDLFDRRFGSSKMMGDFAKLSHWGLIENQTSVDDDQQRSGVWRLTPKGVEFARNRTRIASTRYFYNGSSTPDAAAEFETVEQCLGCKFKYSDII
jgi:hypothetical protein